jgi:hypothetical protein
MSAPKDEQHDRLMSTAHLAERREERYALAIAVTIEGIDQNGQAFHEQVLTDDVSKWGCRFFALVPLRVDDIIAVKLPPPEADGIAGPALFQVVRVDRKGEGWMVAAWRLSEDGFWGLFVERTIEGGHGMPEPPEKTSGSQGRHNGNGQR